MTPDQQGLLIFGSLCLFCFGLAGIIRTILDYFERKNNGKSE